MARYSGGDACSRFSAVAPSSRAHVVYIARRRGVCEAPGHGANAGWRGRWCGCFRCVAMRRIDARRRLDAGQPPFCKTIARLSPSRFALPSILEAWVHPRRHRQARPSAGPRIPPTWLLCPVQNLTWCRNAHHRSAGAGKPAQSLSELGSGSSTLLTEDRTQKP